MHTFDKRGAFDDKDRNKLVSLVHAFVIDLGIDTKSKNLFAFLARQIVETFPGESEVHVF